LRVSIFFLLTPAAPVHFEVDAEVSILLEEFPLMIKTRLAATRLVLLMGALLAGAGSVAAQSVSTNYDTKADFSKYKTYHWVDIQGATYPNQLTDIMIRNAIDSTLKLHGLVRQDSGSVDLYVGYQLATSEQKQWNAYGTGGGAGWRGGAGWGGGGMATATSSTVTDGTLAVDLYDPAMQQLVWQSTATKQLNPSSNAAKNQENMQKATNKMFKDYPPGAKKN